MEIISGHIETLKKKEYIKLSAIDTFWIGQILEDGKWYFYASIGMKSYQLSVHDTESQAVEAMDVFVIELTPEMVEEK
jgi:hypothetical protein